MLFNPQCDHCQHETETMVQQINQFKDVQIVMATTVSISDMIAFSKKYKLDEHKNIVVGQDTQFFLYSFFSVRNMPFHAFYNKKKELISVFEGSMQLEKITAELAK